MFEKAGNNKAKALFNNIVGQKYGSGTSSASTDQIKDLTDFLGMGDNAVQWVQDTLTNEEVFTLNQVMRGNRIVSKILARHGWKIDDEVSEQEQRVRTKIIEQETFPGFSKEYDENLMRAEAIMQPYLQMAEKCMD